jgi:hypothetical protein
VTSAYRRFATSRRRSIDVVQAGIMVLDLRTTAVRALVCGPEALEQGVLVLEINH